MTDIITIVSGLPRSGTSLMMQMLEAGGLEVVTDNERKPDEDNPKGYYEFEKVKKIRKDSSWLDSVRGKSVKMVSDLLYYLPSNRIYKVIFMKRDLREVLASQKKMLQRRAWKDDSSDEEMANLMKIHVDRLNKWLKENGNISVLYVSYNDVIDNPVKNAQVIVSFLNRQLDIDKMVAVIEKSLYRNR